MEQYGKSMQKCISSFTYERWTISRESDQDIVNMGMFTYAAHDRKPSESDVFELLRVVWARGRDFFTLHVLRCNINERMENNIQASRKECEAAIHLTQTYYCSDKAATFLIRVQQHRERPIWQHRRLSGDIFWADVLLNFNDDNVLMTFSHALVYVWVYVTAN